MAANLWLDISLNLPPGCCVDRVYALIFNRQHEVLRDNGAGVLTFQGFTSAQQSLAAIILAEHAQRTSYYFKDLAPGTFTLLPSAANEEYYLEFWRRELTGAFNRAEDILEETRRFRWSGTQVTGPTVAPEDAATLADWQSHVSLTYDSENLAVHFMAHLERNGQLITNPKQMELLWLDEEGETIAHVVQTTFLPNAPGIFDFDLPNLDLDADRTTLLLCTITDVNDIPHTTAQYSNCWD